MQCNAKHNVKLRASTRVYFQFTAENKAVNLSWNTVTMVGLHKDQLTPNFVQLLHAPKPPSLFHTKDRNTEGKNLQGTTEQR